MVALNLKDFTGVKAPIGQSSTLDTTTIEKRSQSEQPVVGPSAVQPEVIDFIKSYEKFRPSAYLPTKDDVWTVGYGRTGKDINKFSTMSEQEASADLLNRLQQKMIELDKIVKPHLNANQQSALLSLVDNVGIGAFKKSKALKALNAGDYDTFKKEAFDAEIGFTKQKGKPLAGLVKRRQQEQVMFDQAMPINKPKIGLDLKAFKPVTTQKASQLNPLAEGTPEKGSALYDYLYGSMVEVPRDLVWGAVSWPMAQLLRHSAVAGQKIQQSLGLLPKMTDQEQAAMGENVANWVQTMGGLATPTTETGKASMELAGKVIEPINKFAHWTAKGVNPETHPNLHNVLATGVEFAAFAAIPKIGKGLKKVAKKRFEAIKLKGKARQNAAIEVAKEQAKLLKEANEAAGMKDMLELVKKRQRKNQQLIAGADGFSAIDVPRKPGPAGPTVSELSQRSRGFETGEIIRPNLGPEPVSGFNYLSPEQIALKVKTAQQKIIENYQKGLITKRQADRASAGLSRFERRQIAEAPIHERLAREGKVVEKTGRDISRFIKDYQEGIIPDRRTLTEISQRGRGAESRVVRPDLGPEPTTRTGATVPIEPTRLGGIKLVENIPGERSVYKIILDPLRNQAGSIRLPRRMNKFKETVAPEIREQVRNLGKKAEEARVTLHDYLKSIGMSDQHIKELTELHQKVKEERPSTGKLEERIPTKDEFKPYELDEGDVQVNTGKKANKNVKVGLNDVRRLSKIPILKKGGLVQGLRTPQNFFSTYKEAKPLMNMKRSMDRAIAKEKEIMTKFFKNTEKEFKNKKLREEVGAYWHSLTDFGKDAMEQMGVKVNENPQYIALKEQLEPIFKDTLERINQARSAQGKKQITEMKDFLAFFAQESFLRDMSELIHGERNAKAPNLFTDDIATIKARHTQTALDMAKFDHVRREGLRKGVKLELDPLVIAQRYMQDAIGPIHYSPLNAFIKEIMTKDLTMPNGQKVNFKKANPGLSAELVSWSNSLIGQSNMPLPYLLEKQVKRLTRNLTVATLVGNFRTTGIQPTALLTTFTEMPVASTKALFSYMTEMGKDVNKKSAPIKDSEVLTAAILDASFTDLDTAIGGTKAQKIKADSIKTLSFFMKNLDYSAREITFRAKWKELEGLVKDGKMTKEEAVRQADEAVIRTQSSGAPGEVAPIQRSALGKMFTLWQTFTIGHINWLAKEVLGIKNPELTPVKTGSRVLRYLLGVSALGYLFEDMLGIQAPGPAPIQAVIRDIEKQKKGGKVDLFKTALTAGREISEIVPFGSSIKFGSSVFGPVVDFLTDVSKVAAGNTFFDQDLLAEARQGDTKAIIKLLEIAGKMTGVPATAQLAKTARGLLRDENLLRAMIGKIDYTKKTGGGKRGRRKSRKSRKSRRRRR